MPDTHLAWNNPTPVPLPRRQPDLNKAHLRLLEPREDLHPILTKRDPDLIRRAYPWVARIVDRYFRTEVQGAENLSDEACLITATHNGGMATPDAYGLAVAFWRRFGLETPAFGLMHKAAFSIPLMGPFLVKMGAVHASRENARIVLRSNFPIVLCPGGDMDALKPYSQRHKITFGDRQGFVRMAISEQVPIIPVVSVGAHETLFVLNDGRRAARLSGLSRLLRIKSVPLTVGFPVGLTPAGLGCIPLPSKITLRILPKIELAEPPEAAEDPAVVQRCFDHVVQTMQGELDDLASRRRWPILG